MIHLRLAFLPLVATACAACSGGTGGGGEIALEDLYDTVVNRVCRDSVACGGFADLASCVESLSLTNEQLIADVEAGLIAYDGVKASDCLASVGNSECSVFGGANQRRASCDQAFTGSIALGQPCFSKESCAGDASCDNRIPDSCTAGICVASIAEALVGQSCQETACTFDAWCNQGICQARDAAGASCESEFNCVRDYLCDLGVNSEIGVCVQVPSTGETCDPQLSAFSRFNCLQSSDYCDPADNTCKRRLALGQSCPESEEFCVGYAECIAGTCVAKIMLGQACNVDSDPACLGSLDCVDGVCIADPVPAICSL